MNWAILNFIFSASILAVPVKVTQLTNSPIKIYATDSLNKGRFLIISGSHGNERLPPKFTKWLIKRISNNQGPIGELVQSGYGVDIIPILNPKGWAEKTRHNSNGVNLNRNFSVLWGVSRENPGKHAFSEMETQALNQQFKKQKYLSSVDVHGYAPWIVAPSAIKKSDKYNSWMKSLQKNILPGYSLLTAGSLGDGGAFEDWAYWKEKVLSFCLEMQSPNEGSTHFLMYEKFLAKMFKEAARIDSNAVASSK